MNTEYDAFIVDSEDVPGDITPDTIERNEKFMTHIREDIRKFDTISCDCGVSAMLVDPKTFMVSEVPPDTISTGDLVLSQIEANNGGASIEASSDKFEYRAIILANDNRYANTVALIRSCKKCGDIRIRGDIDEITRSLGYAFMTAVDCEQKVTSEEEESYEQLSLD